MKNLKDIIISPQLSVKNQKIFNKLVKRDERQMMHHLPFKRERENKNEKRDLTSLLRSIVDGCYNNVTKI